MSTSIHYWIGLLLAELEVPRSSHNARALVAQRQAEGGGAHWNPFNSTVKVGNATVFNTFGDKGQFHVWSYASLQDGIQATAQTFRQSNFAYLLAELKRGDSAQRYWQRLITPPTPPPGVRYDRWGTSVPAGLSIMDWIADVDHHWYDYALRPVPGS